MSFIGDIFGAYAARQMGRYNQQLYNQQATITARNAEIKKTAFENISLPKLRKDQARNKSNLFVSLLKSGVDVDRVGETPYLMMLDQGIEDAFEVTVQTYNSTVAYQNEINSSLILQAQGKGKAYEGEMLYRAGMAKAAGDIYTNKDTYGSLLS